MRVNPNPTIDLLSALSKVQQQQQDDLLQIATGRKINSPSDGPYGASQIVLNHDRSSQVDSFERNMDAINGQLSTADSTLSAVVVALQRAMTLGIQGANGTLSPVDRAAVAAEVQGIQSQLITLGNASYQGQFVFAGTAHVTPFVADPTVASGVRYDGNLGVNSVGIGNNYSVAVNQPGTQVFASPTADMFQSIADLITALNSGTNIDVAVSEISSAFNLVTQQRVFYGNAINLTGAQKTFLDSEKVQLSSQENSLIGADFAETASDLVNTENARNAALAAIGRQPPNSLFDYLR